MNLNMFVMLPLDGQVAEYIIFLQSVYLIYLKVLDKFCNFSFSETINEYIECIS